MTIQSVKNYLPIALSFFLTCEIQFSLIVAIALANHGLSVNGFLVWASKMQKPLVMKSLSGFNFQFLISSKKGGRNSSHPSNAYHMTRDRQMTHNNTTKIM